MKTVNDAFKCVSNQDDLVFNLTTLMRPYVEDLDRMDYAFLNVNAQDQVADDIRNLRRRACEQIASLFKRFGDHIDEDDQCREAMSIVFPFLEDQFEVRLRLLGVYWERMKSQQVVTANPDFEEMGETVGLLAKLIQECGDHGFGREERDVIDDDVAAASPMAA